MQKLFYGVVMSFILVFLYWTAMYFVQGYNLTDKVGHLDFKSMSQSLNNMASFSIYDYIMLPFEKFNELLKNGLPVNNWNVSSGWKLLLNAFNYFLDFLGLLYKPIFFILNLLKNVFVLLEPVNDFVSVVLRFMLYPKFI